MNAFRIKFCGAQCVGDGKAGRSPWKKLLQEVYDRLAVILAWATLIPVLDADRIGRFRVDLLRVGEGRNDFGRSALPTASPPVTAMSFERTARTTEGDGSNESWSVSPGEICRFSVSVALTRISFGRKSAKCTT